MWQKIRQLAIEVYCFLTAPLVLKNCLMIMAAFGAFVMMTFWWLQCYTNSGESLEVPNFEGKAFVDARKTASSRDFRVEIADSIYVTDKAPGIVVSQNPKAGSRVKENRRIYFTITKNNPDLVQLPKLGGVDAYERYSAILARQGFKPRVVSKVYDPRFSVATVLAVIYNGDTITNALEKGAMAEMGATIDLVISDLEPLETEIPDLVCMTYEAAKFLLQSNNINIGRIHKDKDVTDLGSAIIYRQSPRYLPGEKIRMGEQIDVYLTSKKPQACD